MGLPGPMGFRGDSGSSGPVGKPGYPVSVRTVFFDAFAVSFLRFLLLTANSPQTFISLPQVRDTNLFY